MAETIDIVNRLRGIYRIPITDGLGPAGGEEPDNPNEFVRRFETPPIQREAADHIEQQAAEIERLRAGGCARDQGLTQFCAEAAKFAAENAKLRQIVSDSAGAIGNGAAIAPEASLEFMGYLPEEIGLVAARKDAEIERLRAEVDALKNPWRPISEAPDRDMDVQFYCATAVWFYASTGEEAEVPGRERYDVGYWEDGDWFYAGSNHLVFEFDPPGADPNKPTHWRALPPAPHKGE